MNTSEHAQLRLQW